MESLVCGGSQNGHAGDMRVCTAPVWEAGELREEALTSADRVALYSSAAGNYFFHEMRDLLAAGFASLNVNVQTRTELDGYADDVDFHVVIAPHEFFSLGTGPQLKARMPRNVVLVNTEQPSTSWFALARDCFSHAKHIWDIDYDSARQLSEAGFHCDYLPLGYEPTAFFSAPVPRLPRHYGTCFLEPGTRLGNYLDAPFGARPIDVLFVGSPTPRRDDFFSAAAPLLAKYHCYIHFSDCSQPVLAGKNTFMTTETVLGLAQRSKILLNIHRGRDRYFEWQRIVMQGIWQRTLVVTEKASVAPPFTTGLDYVEDDLSDLPEILDYFLSAPEGAAEAQGIIDHGYRTLTTQCVLTSALRRLLDNLRPAKPALVQAVSAGPAPGSDRVRPARPLLPGRCA